MFRKPEPRFFVALGIVLIALPVPILAQTPAPANPSKPPAAQGEITRNDVYVRSGASTNHYTICKLHAGDRITIVGEQGEWLEIVPPRGTFSVISGEYVDTVDDLNGVVNGDNVRVRAGSSLNDQKYTVQATLSRGANVKILGRNPDGFLRIEPPPGATLWINQAYVERVPDALVKLESAADPQESVANVAAQPNAASTSGAAEPFAPSTSLQAPRLSDAEPAKVSLAKKDETATRELGDSRNDPRKPDSRLSEKPGPAEDKPAPAMEKKPTPKSETAPTSHTETVPSPLSLVPSSAQRKSLEEIDAALEIEIAKAPVERHLQPIMDRYQRVVEQSEDEFAQRYAEARLGQLKGMAGLVETLQRIRALNEEAEAKRRQYMQERANADFVTLPTVPAGFDAQGELRVSALYPPGSSPRRFRLIEPGVEGRTIAYVELPPDSTIAIEAFLGRFVGVRASEKRLQVGGVDPVPIYLTRELVLLQPAPAVNTNGQS
jgi:uncharacterized protein YgiM (DUF1202 family)